MYDWAAAELALDLGLGTPDEDYTICRRCGQTERDAELACRYGQGMWRRWVR